jgi:hypothetical protein
MNRLCQPEQASRLEFPNELLEPAVFDFAAPNFSGEAESLKTGAQKTEPTTRAS